ncbi:UDP-3-O-(3-hydroxymyristoyl)glucosamine N-acyltransferase [Roseicitreum antarcticum]|uniref:UDP-3-O-[3-hydroxymyristoyl] glucosamine N-acyltransferase n=1 Tax=Roseicitreum antarcticum TaxID=564137 RepID=A0A1H2TXT5_9RHOB|nr:UDP-3-O-(3-hydroxymyristoyl)glucosamine N-acyltransferase [Roseicitreum antarcticum]SDW47964.1 UDP-3-O-[3-hydroxymyristoyl] glucosamine N-acyltransferase [Roseicitreum antarcticum]
MKFQLSDIAAALGARLEGRGDLTVTHAAEPADAGPDALALALQPKFAEGLAQGRARAALLYDGADWRALGLEAAIFAPRPRYAMSGLTRAMDAGPDIAPGIHASAVIDPSARIGAGARIGPLVVVGRDVVIGARARIAAHVSIDAGAQIGDDALILPGVRIGHHVQIGDRFIAQPNAVIGGDGFSFVTPEKSRVEAVRETRAQTETDTAQHWERIHSLGTVVIGDDVEIGSTAAIDRGTIRATRIGSGTKLDNMVHIGHNVVIGQDCLLCGQVGIAGSTVLGDRIVLAGRVAVNDNIFVGDDVIAGGGAMIFTNVPAGRVIWGHPAVKMETQVEINKAVRRLPRLFTQVAELQKLVTQSRDKG